MSGWDFDPPLGVPDSVALAYGKLVHPLILVNSLISLSTWPTEDDEYLCSHEEHLKNARRWAQEFLHLEEIRLRAEAPEVFAVGKDILRSTWSLSSALTVYRHSLGPQNIESTDGRREEMPAEWVTKFTGSCRKALSQTPDPPITSLVDRLRTAVCHWAEALRVKPIGNVPPSPASVGQPTWLRDHFQQKQYKLLTKLWGGEDVTAESLAAHLGYTNPITALSNLHRRVTETNKGLAEKVEAIGEQWEIGQRTRDDKLSYYLRCFAK